MIRRTVVIGVLICAAWAVKAEAQRGGGAGRWGGRRGQRGENQERFEEMRRRMEALSVLNVEAMWAVLSFGVGLTPEQLAPLQGPFAAAWNKRASILAEAEKAKKPDWGAVKDEFKDMKKDLDQRLKAALSEDQQKAYSKQMRPYKNARFQGDGFPPMED